ncbi:hypothetical protein [Roseateles depolymerans]|uniref:Uncharacterized protein n=1 Tax=Roseateles depolymerans TaxID=76731 RepID=A0A0U3MIR7_9BURK|nr:hypothetical protein [Roseateles depolymerans]ALV08297.1 hypothetical protein RD2015_3846 [Roseateles depolymerans]REG21479.1 hypothetical protein DES44_0598 [Roseateles depolymerans]
MSYNDPMTAFVHQLRSREVEIQQRLQSVDVLDGPGGRTFLEAKMELQRADWAAQIGLQLRHGLLKKVAGKL